MYKIIIKKKAKKFIDKLPMPTKKRIIEAINLLPYGSDIKQRKGMMIYSDCVSAITELFIQWITVN